MAAVKLDIGKGIPTVTIEVQYSQPAKCKCWLESTEGEKIMQWDGEEINLADTEGITKTQDLIEKYFFWDIRPINITSESDKDYLVKITFLQDGDEINVEECSGVYVGDTALCFDSAKFH
jgi:hypothetical protein